MKLKIITKISAFYLYVVSIFYFLTGISAFYPLVERENNFLSLLLNYLFLFFGITADALGMAPSRLLKFTNSFSTGFSGNPYLSYLGFLAIFFSIFSILALIFRKRFPYLIYIWYFLDILLLIISIDNFFYRFDFYFKTPGGTNPLYIFSFIIVILQFLSTFFIHKELRDNKSELQSKTL